MWIETTITPSLRISVRRSYVLCALEHSKAFWNTFACLSGIYYSCSGCWTRCSFFISRAIGCSVSHLIQSSRPIHGKHVISVIPISGKLAVSAVGEGDITLIDLLSHKVIGQLKAHRYFKCSSECIYRRLCCYQAIDVVEYGIWWFYSSDLIAL